MKLKHIVTVGILALAFGFSPLTLKAETVHVGGMVVACRTVDLAAKLFKLHAEQGLEAARAFWAEVNSGPETSCASLPIDQFDGERLGQFVVPEGTITLFEVPTSSGQKIGVGVMNVDSPA
jgi:hypothetical protein